MGNISAEQFITIVAGTVAIVTAIWHAAMNIGKLTVKVQRHEDRINGHETRLDDHDQEFRFLKGIQSK